MCIFSGSKDHVFFITARAAGHALLDLWLNLGVIKKKKKGVGFIFLLHVFCVHFIFESKCRVRIFAWRIAVHHVVKSATSESHIPLPRSESIMVLRTGARGLGAASDL